VLCITDKKMRALIAVAALTVSLASRIYAAPVLVTESSLPQSISYVDLGTITVSSKFYGSADALFPKLADKARKKGANVVINVHSYLAPSGFAWAAPHLSGQAIRMNDLAQLDRLQVQYRQY
jgi:hypothetical protein